MATNHTENYALNLWEPTDSFLREEFNENTQKIETALTAHDTALAQKADAAGTTAALAKKTEIVTGTYVGTGTQQNPSQSIELGFRPKALIIWFPLVAETPNCVPSVALALDGQPWMKDSRKVLEITDTGFTVTHIYNSNNIPLNPALNLATWTYRYIAFR